MGIIVALSIITILLNGLTFGIDFTGGTILRMEIETGGGEYADEVISILKDRLNKMGLKSTQVLKEAGNKYITIKVSTTEETELEQLRDIINQQALFEQMVEGELAASGDEIQLDAASQGGSFIQGTSWKVYVKATGEAPKRSGNVMEGMAGHMTDIFLDRPSESLILLTEEDCTELASQEFRNHVEDTGYTTLSFIEERANVPVICYSTEKVEISVPEDNLSILDELGIAINGTLNETANETETTKTFDLSSAVAEIDSLVRGGGIKEIIIPINSNELPAELLAEVEKLNITLTEVIKGESEWHINYAKTKDRPDNDESWVDNIIGIKSTLQIGEGLTSGGPVYSSVFEGGSATEAAARETVLNFKIWLKSGSLPVKADIVSERPNLPELGQEFLKYAGLIALVAIGFVACIVSLRYRKPKISALILVTGFSEVLMILGFASITSWELDLAAIAGIIAAIGTGVDHQIIITDEALRGNGGVERKDKKIWDLKQSIDRAFFIIFTSALTTICAMVPLYSISDLRGFAVTAIVGVLIGILISRPAYARLVEKFL